MDRIADWIAFVILLVIVVAITVGLFLHGDKPIGELPSWVLFPMVVVLANTINGRGEKR